MRIHHNNNTGIFIYFLITLVSIVFFSNKLYAQSDFVEFGDKQYNLLERIKVKLKNDPILSFTTVKEVSRQQLTEAVEAVYLNDQQGKYGNLFTDMDRWDMRNLLRTNRDYTQNFKDSFEVRKPILNFFYPTEAHLADIQGKEKSYVIVDPMLNLSMGKSLEDLNSQYYTTSPANQKLFQNTRGLRLRGMIDGKIGFYTIFTENQERDPYYVQQVVNPYPNKSIIGLPGANFYKAFDGHAGAFDYFNVRGGVSFSVSKKVDFQLAFDQFQIGDGYRSLFISNYGAPFFYLRMNAKLGNKVTLTSVGAQTIAPFSNNPASGVNARDSTRPRSYMVFHYLDWQATDWLKVGAFENTMINGAIKATDPTAIIGTDPTQGPISTSEKGTTTRSRVGIDARVIPVKDVEVYGQWLIDGLTKVASSNWKDRNAFQLGAKYMDAFAIPNLNLQAETNIVRPYAYSSNYVENNYTQYNMPLAHPLGANFREYIGLISYRPINKLYLNAKAIMYTKGLDEIGYNYGGNLLFPMSYNRPSDKISIGDGDRAKVKLFAFNASYELIQNLFIDANYSIRDFKSDVNGTNNIKFYSIGLRWNMARRDFDF
ncbi:hypothetical protein [Rhizosphaericola mali]|uniref:Capsule assembly Wzi family protein n=1 Tax=Rhizosphaericola mali TaxID=2545455 RepID=A0A5P2G019_9BACT|nr:hypothetical protein [Rhizosphaericola mali]QES87998.1 capsule assembly Wzi family protein [Rhizosphaericola mali]